MPKQDTDTRCEAQPKTDRELTVIITEVDSLDRLWTIVAMPAVVGFRYTVYLYGERYHTGALELLFPGGVANGWSKMDPHDGPGPLMRAIALAMGTDLAAVAGGGS